MYSGCKVMTVYCMYSGCMVVSCRSPDGESTSFPLGRMSIQQAAAAGKKHDSSTGNLTSLVRIPQKRLAEGFVLTDVVVSIKLNSKSYFEFFSDRNICLQIYLLLGSFTNGTTGESNRSYSNPLRVTSFQVRKNWFLQSRLATIVAIGIRKPYAKSAIQYAMTFFMQIITRRQIQEITFFHCKKTERLVILRN